MSQKLKLTKTDPSPILTLAIDVPILSQTFRSHQLASFSPNL